MYFSRQGFKPLEEVAEAARRGADEAVRLAAQHFGIHLDHSYESIPEVDRALECVRQMLQRVRLTREMAAPFAEKFGSYVGEALRSRFGGEWGVARLFGEEQTAICLGPRSIVVLPWVRALDRVLEGPEKGLWNYCERARKALETPQPGPPIDRPLREHFTLQPGQSYFDTGITRDGRQALMHVFRSGLTAIFFDAEGNLLSWDVRPLLVSRAESDYSEFTAAVEVAVKTWKREIAFCEEPIRVRQFAIEELGVGIEDLPDDDAEFLEAPELHEPDEQARQERWETIREWRDSGYFVLYWGNDLWLDGDGHVTSS